MAKHAKCALVGFLRRRFYRTVIFLGLICAVILLSQSHDFGSSLADRVEMIAHRPSPNKAPAVLPHANATFTAPETPLVLVTTVSTQEMSQLRELVGVRE
jgi:hypothetical protein